MAMFCLFEVLAKVENMEESKEIVSMPPPPPPQTKPLTYVQSQRELKGMQNA